jgi:hypothetical protein
VPDVAGALAAGQHARFWGSLRVLTGSDYVREMLAVPAVVPTAASNRSDLCSGEGGGDDRDAGVGIDAY